MVFDKGGIGRLNALKTALHNCASSVPELLPKFRSEIDLALAKGDGDSLCKAALNAAECFSISGHIEQASKLANLVKECSQELNKTEYLIIANCRLAKAAIITGELQLARPLLMEALTFYRHRRPMDYDALVDVYISLAACTRTPEEDEKDIQLLRYALRHAPKTKDAKQWEVLVRISLADKLRQMGKVRKSDQILSEAVRLAESTNAEQLLQVHLSLNVAQSCLHGGFLSKAESHAAHAVFLANKMGLPYPEVRALEIQGKILARQGDRAGSVSKYDRALTFARSLGLKKNIAALLNLSATVLLAACHYDTAEDRLKEAFSIHMELEDRIGMGSDLLQLGLLYNHVNQLGQAMVCFHKAHDLAESVNDHRGVLAALTNGANIHSRDSSEPESKRIAIIMLDKALKLARRINDNESLASILVSSGHARWTIGEKKVARKLYMKGLQAAQKIGDQHGIGVSMMNLAMADREMGKIKDAIQRYRRGYKYFIKSRALEEQAHAQHQLGKCYDIADDPIKAFEAYLEEIRINRLARSGLEDIQHRRTFLHTRLEGYENAIRSCLVLAERKKRPEFVDLAFLLSEEARWHTGRESLGLDSESVFVSLSEKTTDPTIAQPHYLKLREQVFSGKDGDKRLLISFFMGRTMSVMFIQRSENKHVLAKLLPWDWVAINSIIYSSRSDDLDVVPDVFGCMSQPRWRRWRIPKHFLRFSSIIKQEVKLHAKPDDLIIFVPHAHLNLIPWSALVDTGDGENKQWHFLIEDHPIAIIPSSYIIRSQQSQQIPGSALVVGNPDPDGSNLDNAENEAKIIGSLLDCEPLLGKNATKELVLKCLQDKSIFHFAGHGRYIGLDLERTGLLLANNEPLSVAEMAIKVKWQNKLLVTLSACSTGIRFPDRADDEPSMLSSLLSNGCESVIASLWPVDDDATATIMGTFYANWVRNRQTKAQALREAILSFIAEERAHSEIAENEEAPVFPPRLHPYFWAPFQLWGSWK